MPKNIEIKSASSVKPSSVFYFLRLQLLFSAQSSNIDKRSPTIVGSERERGNQFP